MTYTNRRVRFENLNYRIVIDNVNQCIWFEKSKKDAVGNDSWTVCARFAYTAN